MAVDSQSIITKALEAALETLVLFQKDLTAQKTLLEAAQAMATCLRNKGQIFTCGNGGSMADAMHFAEELGGRFRKNRPPLAASAIADPSYLSCVANDFGYDEVFARYLRAHGRPGDFLIALSTSGESPNVLKGAQAAIQQGMKVFGLTGNRKTIPLTSHLHWHIKVGPPSSWADTIQEMHMKILHILVALIEKELFGEKNL